MTRETDPGRTQDRPGSAHTADCVAPPSPAYVRQYLRANLFDGDEGGTLTVKISDHLDFLVELFLDLHAEVTEDEANHV